MIVERLAGAPAGPPFPLHADLVGSLLAAHLPGAPGERDAVVAHALGTCSGYAYADADTVGALMSRIGLEGNACVRLTQTVDAMLVFSTAYLVQSRCGRDWARRRANRSAVTDRKGDPVKQRIQSALMCLVLMLAGLSPLTAQITSGFVSITPCRLMDTRLGSAQGYPAPYGAPNFAANAKRVIVATGAIATNNPCANVVPTFATGIAANFTVAQIPGAGDLRIAPGDLTGNPTPLSNSILNFNPPTSAIANATSADIDGSGRLTIQTAVSGAAVIVDVFGYYTREGTSNGAIVAGKNDGTGNGVLGTTQGTDNTSAGVSGHGDNGAYGVSGQSSTNDGVHGLSTDGFGVGGSSSNSDGVHGFGVIGVHGIGEANIGVEGTATTGVGVHGVTSSSVGTGVLAEGNGAGTALDLRNGAMHVSGTNRSAKRVSDWALCTPSTGATWGILDSPFSNGDSTVIILLTSLHSRLSYSTFYNPSADGTCPGGMWLVAPIGADMDRFEDVGILIITR